MDLLLQRRRRPRPSFLHSLFFSLLFLFFLSLLSLLSLSPGVVGSPKHEREGAEQPEVVLVRIDHRAVSLLLSVESRKQPGKGAKALVLAVRALRE